MKLLILDYEVFKHDTLMGILMVDKENETVFQTWDLEEMRNFYNDHKNDMWITWNGNYYDIPILETILNHRSPYQKSKDIISGKYKPRITIPIYTYDIMNVGLPNPTSLKLTELISGHSIETTEVSFDIDRPLNEEEKRLTEKYNVFDLKQTLYNFEKFKDRFELRLSIINEFNLDLMSNLRATGTSLAAQVLGAKKDSNILSKKIFPKLYDNLILENEELKEYVMSEAFRDNKSIVINIGDAEIHIGAGGGHSAQAKKYFDKCLYCDVNGYYNRIMIVYNLLSRTLPESGKELYAYMFDQQNKLKKTNPKARAMYKTVLLSVFGAMNNEYTDFYDPWTALLVTTTGELFIVDLMEKLKDLVTFVQTNTDGLMIQPHDWNDEPKIQKIIDEWCERTHFVIKREYIYDLYQRDVNNYVYKDADGEFVFKGEALKNYKFDDESYASGTIFSCKEPPIIAQGIIEWFMNDTLPEDYVEEHKKDLKLFQYACKKNSFDYLTYNTMPISDFKKDIVKSMLNSDNTKSTNVGSLVRVFAYDSNEEYGMIFKHKNGKIEKVSNLPDSVFVYNKEILSEDAYENLKDKIDWNYYVKRIYDKINKFI